MKFLVLVFLFLTVNSCTGELFADMTALQRATIIKECIDSMHRDDANLTLVVECLAQAGNQMIFFQHTLWKLDLLVRRLEGLQRILSANPNIYVPSPYKNVDDVMKIEGSVAGYSCQEKLFVVQAIRRKLEQVYIMNGVKSTLFKWPFLRKRPNLGLQPVLPPLSNAFQARSGDYSELICLILLAIEKHSKKIK